MRVKLPFCISAANTGRGFPSPQGSKRSKLRANSALTGKDMSKPFKGAKPGLKSGYFSLQTRLMMKSNSLMSVFFIVMPQARLCPPNLTRYEAQSRTQSRMSTPSTLRPEPLASAPLSVMRMTGLS